MPKLFCLILPLPKPIVREKLEVALRDLDAGVWRAKGFVRLAGENDLFLVQFASPGRQFSIVRFEARSLNSHPTAELVFIGLWLDEAAFRRSFGLS